MHWNFAHIMAKFQCIAFSCLFIFYHIPEVYSVDNSQDWKIQGGVYVLMYWFILLGNR